MKKAKNNLKPWLWGGLYPDGESGGIGRRAGLRIQWGDP